MVKMDKMKVLVTGDFFGGNKVERLIDDKQYDILFGDLIFTIREADISITNLESPLFDFSLPPIKKTGPALKAKTNVLKALENAGFNILTLANNHILDFGVKGLESTINAINNSKIDYVGAGDSLVEARKIKYVKKETSTLAIINFCENEWSTTNEDYPGANPFNPVANFYDIKEAKKNANKVIVILHGGIEFSSYPTVSFKDTCRFFIDAGADAVICHHTHFMSGYEEYNKGLIFYGLGNFIFDSQKYKNHQWNYGFAVELIFDLGIIDFKLIPYKQCNEETGLVLLNEKENKEFEKKIKNLNEAIKCNETLRIELNSFVERTEKLYLAYLQPYSNRILKGLFKRGMIPSLYNTNKYRLLLNIIRCESHHEVLKKVLKNKTK
jgi:poly-gamma-glutamate synthesis protein (capsule biosynthesis protein)